MDFFKQQLIIWCVLPIIASATTALVIGIILLAANGASNTLLLLGGVAVVVMLVVYYIFARIVEEVHEDAHELRNMLAFSLNQPLNISPRDRELMYFRNIIIHMMYIPSKFKMYFHDLSSDARLQLRYACLNVIQEKEEEMRLISEEHHDRPEYRTLRKMHATLISMQQMLKGSDYMYSD